MSLVRVGSNGSHTRSSARAPPMSEYARARSDPVAQQRHPRLELELQGPHLVGGVVGGHPLPRDHPVDEAHGAVGGGDGERGRAAEERPAARDEATRGDEVEGEAVEAAEALAAAEPGDLQVVREPRDAQRKRAMGERHYGEASAGR